MVLRPLHGAPVSGSVVRLDGARALVTGASSGIGLAVVEHLASRGVLVAVTGRQRLTLDRLAERSGGCSVVADLRRPGAPQQVVTDAAAALGGLDIVVNNAGVGWAGPFEEMRSDDLDELLDTNLRAALHVTRAALGYLRKQGGGHLVYIGSVAGLLAVADEAVYSATKAALLSFAEALRGELDGSGIGVSVVNPGPVATPFFARRNRPYQRAWPRPIPADAVARAVMDCLDTGRDEVTVPGWMARAAQLHGTFPAFYRRLAHRFG